MPDHIDTETTSREGTAPHPRIDDPRAQARQIIAETTQVLTSQPTTIVERVTAYRRRAHVWRQLAGTSSYG